MCSSDLSKQGPNAPMYFDRRPFFARYQTQIWPNSRSGLHPHGQKTKCRRIRPHMEPARLGSDRNRPRSFFLSTRAGEGPRQIPTSTSVHRPLCSLAADTNPSRTMLFFKLGKSKHDAEAGSSSGQHRHATPARTAPPVAPF